MVTVAKSFDAPIKLLWPKNFFVDPLQFSMLGLGDIVIPGKLSLPPPLSSHTVQPVNPFFIHRHLRRVDASI